MRLMKAQKPIKGIQGCLSLGSSSVTLSSFDWAPVSSDSFSGFAQHQLSIFICEIWRSFHGVHCLLLNASDICLWPLARLLYKLQQLLWYKRLPQDGGISQVFCSIWTELSTDFGATCCFMPKPRNNSLLWKGHLQRARKQKRTGSAIFCY